MIRQLPEGKDDTELTFGVLIVDTNHWAPWEKPREVNGVIVEWLGQEFSLVSEENKKAKL